MSEHLSGPTGLDQHALIAATCALPEPQSFEHLGIIDRLSNRWAALVALGATAATFAISPLAESPATAENTKQAVVGMPFEGRWGYNSLARPPYTDATSSHPSVHHTPGGGDWATDLYPSGEGTEVKLKVAATSGNLSFSWGASGTSCGESTMVKVHVDNNDIGSLYFAHIAGAVKTGEIKNGMVLGKTKQFYDNDGKECNPAKHVHMEVTNKENYSCYADNGIPGEKVLKGGVPLGVLGSSNTTKEACSSVPDADTRPTSPTNLPWRFENMEGDAGSMSTFNADTGKAPTAAVFNSQLYVASYEHTGGNLRLARTNPDWVYGTLDGISGSGRKNADVGRTPSLVVHGNTLHGFYYDKTGGNLRHAWTQDGVSWRYEDLDGTAGSILGRNRNIGETPAAVSHSDGSLHVFYRDVDGANLIHAWALPGQEWRSETLEGDPNSVSRKDGDIGHDPVAVSYDDAVHAFHHNKTTGTLRHAWKTDSGVWRFEDLDGTPNSICGKNVDTGKNPAAVVHNGTLQVLSHDADNKDLRHYWSDQAGWHCETLEGDTNAVLGNGETGGEVGAMPSFVSLNGQLHGLAKETKYGSVRHYWTDGSGWHAENFDGLGGNPAGRVSHSTGDDPLAVRFGTTPQFFWYDNTKGDLRHSIPN